MQNINPPRVVPVEVYAVFVKHLDRNQLLGYCSADCWEDIEAYYAEKKAYGLELEVVRPIRIPSGYANKKDMLAKQRKELEKQIKDLNRQIDLIKD